MHHLDITIDSTDWTDIKDAIDNFIVEIKTYLSKQEPWDKIKYLNKKEICKLPDTLMLCDPVGIIEVRQGNIIIWLRQEKPVLRHSKTVLVWRAQLFNNGRELHSLYD